MKRSSLFLKASPKRNAPRGKQSEWHVQDNIYVCRTVASRVLLRSHMYAYCSAGDRVNVEYGWHLNVRTRVNSVIREDNLK